MYIIMGLKFALSQNLFSDESILDDGKSLKEENARLELSLKNVQDELVVSIMYLYSYTLTHLYSPLVE